MPPGGDTAGQGEDSAVSVHRQFSNVRHLNEDRRTGRKVPHLNCGYLLDGGIFFYRKNMCTIFGYQ